MAKAIRWQVPFASVSGTRYRVDIYDEQDGSWSGSTTLLAGETPFTTDEDNSDDFFAPVRTQTGTLQICTLLPNGGRISLDDLLPANNIARPVRLVNISGSTEVIEWQGFLSCEAYSQNYTSIPENLDLPLISVLEAMDSVEVQLDENMAFKTIMGHMAYAMKAIETQSGMSLFDQVYISSYCRTAMTSAYFYNNVYFSAEEQISGDNIVVDVHSISCKDILEQVAKFFGGCWREVKQNVYLNLPGKQSYSFHSLTAIYNYYTAGTGGTPMWLSAAGTTADIADSEWRGADHKRDIRQGARRVKVTASLEEFECKMSLQECPVGSLVENPSARQSKEGEVHVNTNETFYSLAEHKHMLAKAVFPTDLSGAHLDFVQYLSGINYANTIFWTDNDFRTYYSELVVDQTKGSNSGISYYLTSFMAWWRDKEGELQSGLMICGVPKRLYWSYSPIQGRVWNKFALTADNYLFKQQSPLIFAASKGYLKIDIHTLAWSGADGTMPRYVYRGVPTPTLTVAISIGNKYAYYDSSSASYKWASGFRTIDFPLDLPENTDKELKTKNNWSESMGVDESDGIFINIPSFMVGVVSVRVYHEIDAICYDPYTNGMFDVFINKLDVEYVPLAEELLTDRSENVYAQEIGDAFRDEISTDLDIATDARNTKLATMLWQSDGITPVKLLSLGGASVRPEKDLLDRLAAYYGQARQTLTLEVAHPSTPLPLLRLNGINDGKVYAPMAESRDWRMEVSTLTCMEIPQS